MPKGIAITYQDVRAAAQQLGEFTFPEIAERMGVSPSSVGLQEQVGRLVDAEAVCVRGRRREGQKGRPPIVFAFVRPTGPKVVREKKTPPEAELIGAPVMQRRQEVSHKRHRKRRSPDTETNRLVEFAVERGWDCETTGRGKLKLIPPDEGMSPVILAKSPSDWRAVKNARATLRARGLDVP